MTRWAALLLLLAACQPVITHQPAPGPTVVEIVEVRGQWCSHQHLMQAITDQLDTSRIILVWRLVTDESCTLSQAAIIRALSESTADVLAIPYGADRPWVPTQIAVRGASGRLLVVAAAGNRPGPAMFPARYYGAVAVGALCEGAPCPWSADSHVYAASEIGYAFGATSGATVAAAVWAGDQAARCGSIRLPRYVHAEMSC